MLYSNSLKGILRSYQEWPNLAVEKPLSEKEKKEALKQFTWMFDGHDATYGSDYSVLNQRKDYVLKWCWDVLERPPQSVFNQVKDRLPDYYKVSFDDFHF